MLTLFILAILLRPLSTYNNLPATLLNDMNHTGERTYWSLSLEQ